MKKKRGKKKAKVQSCHASGRRRRRCVQGQSNVRRLVESAGGTKLLEFQARGSSTGREFSAEISVRGDGVSVAAQIASQEHLPCEWRKYCVYAAKVVFEYHNDEGPEHNVHLDAATGVRLLGENVLPNAVLLGSGWDAENHRWKLLREHGKLSWRGTYEMPLPELRELALSKRLLEFSARGSTPGRRFSANLVFHDDSGQDICDLPLLNDIILPLETTAYCFDVEDVALTYHNDQGCGHDIYVDTAMGVRLLGEDVLRSAVLLDSGWDPDNPRWKSLREGGNLAWQGRYEMRPSAIKNDNTQP